MDTWTLNYRQNLPLKTKEKYTKRRIIDWYEYWDGKVYVSFSGGKDSTVLLHQVRRLFPEVTAVFVNTGLEYPEIIEFVKTIENVIWLRPKLPFHKVIEKHGYPIVSKEVANQIQQTRISVSDYMINKRLYGDKNGNGKIPKKWMYLLNAPFKISDYCCYHLKKAPLKKIKKLFPFIGLKAQDSGKRFILLKNRECNMYQAKFPSSNPLSFWLEKDIWNYLKKYQLPYSKIYDKGYERTGCMFCMFGVHLEKEPNRFQKMKITHPKQYEYCINKLGCGKVLDYINVPY